tara:strand:+ start:1372 stop:1770 length:399 start_codon:yes stop_codon:yes gene_type:complete
MIDYKTMIVALHPVGMTTVWTPLSAMSPDLPDDIMVKIQEGDCDAEGDARMICDVLEKHELEAREGSIRSERLESVKDIIDLVNEIVGSTVVKCIDFTIVDSIEAYVKMCKKVQPEGYALRIAANETEITGV